MEIPFYFWHLVDGSLLACLCLRGLKIKLIRVRWKLAVLECGKSQGGSCFNPTAGVALLDFGTKKVPSTGIHYISANRNCSRKIMGVRIRQRQQKPKISTG
jgi:hypothetical protein